MAKNYDQIRADNPLTVIDGTETFTAQKAGVTVGGFLSVLKTWVLSTFVASNITNSTATGRSLITAVDAAAGRTAIGAEPARTTVSQADAETGTSTTVTAWTAQRVRQSTAAYSDPKKREALVLSATTAVTAEHVNRTLIADSATPFDFNLPSSGSLFATTDTILLVNLGTAAVTIQGGTSLKQKGTGTITSYSLPVNGIVKAWNVGSNAWFLEV